MIDAVSCGVLLIIHDKNDQSNSLQLLDITMLYADRPKLWFCANP